MLDGERNQLIPSATAGRTLPARLAYTRLRGVPHSILKDHSCPSLWAGQPAGYVAPLGDRESKERRVGCSMDSSCELLRSLDPASVSVHCCEVPCRTLLRNISKVVTFRDVLLGFASLRRCEITREAHRWVCGEARRALL